MKMKIEKLRIESFVTGENVNVRGGIRATTEHTGPVICGCGGTESEPFTCYPTWNC